MSRWIVEYAEGHREDAVFLCNNRFISVESEIQSHNLLLVSGADERVEQLEEHDSIKGIEPDSKGHALAGGTDGGGDDLPRPRWMLLAAVIFGALPFAIFGPEPKGVAWFFFGAVAAKWLIFAAQTWFAGRLRAGDPPRIPLLGRFIYD